MLAVLPGVWEVSLLFYVATDIFDELREDSSALPTIVIVITPLAALMKDQVIFVQIILYPHLTID